MKQFEGRLILKVIDDNKENLNNFLNVMALTEQQKKFLKQEIENAFEQVKKVVVNNID